MVWKFHDLCVIVGQNVPDIGSRHSKGASTTYVDDFIDEAATQLISLLNDDWRWYLDSMISKSMHMKWTTYTVRT